MEKKFLVSYEEYNRKNILKETPIYKEYMKIDDNLIVDYLSNNVSIDAMLGKVIDNKNIM